MKSWRVYFHLGDMLHVYVVDAEHEAEAIMKVMKSLVHPEIMKDFRIERYYEEWN